MEVLNEISKGINWYRDNNSKATPEQLLKLKDNILTRSYNLAEMVAEYKLKYNLCHFTRRIEISRQKNALIRGGRSATSAESEATENTAGEYKSELENEAMAYRLDLLLKQSNKVAEAITQRLAILRDELKRPN